MGINSVVGTELMLNQYYLILKTALQRRYHGYLLFQMRKLRLREVLLSSHSFMHYESIGRLSRCGFRKQT